MSEPKIIINGYPLNSAQSLAVRVAVSQLYVESCNNPRALGKDDTGLRLTQAYKDRSREVLDIMSKARPEPTPPPIKRRSRATKNASVTVATHA